MEEYKRSFPQQNADETDYDKPTKKRNRLSLSCNYCKKRKVKCDRGMPCTACVRYNVSDLCQYPEQIPERVGRDSGNISGATTFVLHNPSNGRGVENSNNTVGNGNGKLEMQLELSALKDKIKLLEDSLQPNPDTTSNKTPPQTNGFEPIFHQKSDTSVTNSEDRNGNISFPGIPDVSSNVKDGSFTFNSPSLQHRLFQVPSSSKSNIQLPPLSWSSQGKLSNDSASQVSLDKIKYDANNPSESMRANPYDDPEELINFYDDHLVKSFKINTIRSGVGVYSWFNIYRKDGCMSKIYDLFSSGNPNIDPFCDTILSNGSNDKNGLNGPYKEKAHNPDNYQSSNQEEFTFRDNNSDLNRELLILGMSFHDENLDKEEKLSNKILKILPNQKVIWILIHKYFLYVYPFLPYVDEGTFTREISRIIGPKNYNEEKVDKLNVNGQLDFAYLGLLLAFLRFSYLALFSNKREVNEYNLNNDDPNQDAQELRYLLSNPIKIQVTEVSHLCLNQFNLFKNPHFVVLQLFYTLRLYHMFGPEEGDGVDGGFSQIAGGTIANMAYALSLNREPDLVDVGEKDERKNNCARKLWFFIVTTDLIISYQFGTPLVINNRSFDTRLPFYRVGNENIKDVEMEKLVTSSFAYFGKYYKIVRTLLDMTVNITEPNKISRLTECIDEFERFMWELFGTLSDFVVPFSEEKFPHPFVKTMKCKNYINLSGFFVSILHNIFYHFEKKKKMDLAAFYLKKSFACFLGEILPYISELIYNNHINFGPAADLIMNPILSIVCHKALQLNVVTSFRVNGLIYKLKNSPSHNMEMKNYDYQLRFNKYVQLSKAITTTDKFIMKWFSKLSDRYYYAWRIIKTHNFLSKISCYPTLYKKLNFDDMVDRFSEIKIEDIDELIYIFQTSFEKMTQVAKSSETKEVTKLEKNVNSPFKETPSTNPMSTVNEDYPSSKFNSPFSGTGENISTISSTDFDGNNDLSNNKGIDQLWYQILSMQNESGSGYPNQNNDNERTFRQQSVSELLDTFDEESRSVPNQYF